MNYTIIEDCSPYYIRLTFDGLADIISFVASQTFDVDGIVQRSGYQHHTFDAEIGKQILDMLPMSKLFEFEDTRVSTFITPPGGKCWAHKDGRVQRVSFNIPIQILDDKCVTSWYTDEELADCEVVGYPYSRSAKQFYNKPRKAIKTMTAQPGEFILFNTDIWHSWNNSKSPNTRKMLTIRLKNPKDVYFEDAKNILFNSTDQSQC